MTIREGWSKLFNFRPVQRIVIIDNEKKQLEHQDNRFLFYRSFCSFDDGVVT